MYITDRYDILSYVKKKESFIGFSFLEESTCNSKTAKFQSVTLLKKVCEKRSTKNMLQCFHACVHCKRNKDCLEQFLLILKGKSFCSSSSMEQF